MEHRTIFCAVILWIKLQCNYQNVPKMPPSNKTSGGKASIPQVASINPRYIIRNFGPIPRRTTVFHIEKNGEVKLGYLSNLEQFEGEVIRPLPHDMYPENLFSSDLIWPCYMICVEVNTCHAYLSRSMRPTVS